MSRRADIQGLRALAVIVVVLYHVNDALLPGGFVGVDVFFVISGFVITRLLISGKRRTGHVDALGFYARRFLRIFPAAALVGVITLVASYLILSPIEAADVERSATASSLFIANFRFAAETLSYAGGALNTDPFLHYWTLGVEEQFYLVWPLTLIVGMALPRVRRLSPLPILLAALFLISFALAIVYTDRSQPYAFFLLPFRFWEFAAGGLLALVDARGWQLRRRMGIAASVTGLALVAWACITFDAWTRFPAPAAAIPVAGALLLIASGETRQPVSRVMASRAAGWVGDRSYSIYLWHWPFLVLGPLVLGSDAVGTRFALAALSVAAAAIAFRFVENPIRFSPNLRARPSRGLAVGVLAAGVFLVATLGLKHETNRALGNPQQAELVAARSAAPDVPRCQLTFSQVTYDRSSCVFGPKPSKGTVLLFGDSHATQLLPGVEQAAARRGWSVVLRTKDACPPADVTTTVSAFPGRSYRECADWRSRVMDEIRDTRPEVVVTSSALEYMSGDQAIDRRAFAEGIQKTTSEITRDSVRVLGIVGTPEPGFDVPVCLSRELSSIISVDCTIDRETALDRPNLDAVAAAVRRGGGTALDVSDVFCVGSECAPRLGNVVVYRDEGHITSQAAALLTPMIRRGLDEVERQLRP